MRDPRPFIVTKNGQLLFIVLSPTPIFQMPFPAGAFKPISGAENPKRQNVSGISEI
jgi:hypothetical protein